MKEKIKLINNRLTKLIPQKNTAYKALFEAAAYSLDSKGKRIRPLLVMLTVEALNEDIEKAIDPACAIELIHTYSLIHDDLPSMDNDDFRRGKPSLHKAYPEWLAILTGDYLLTYAFEVLANSNLEDSKKIQIIKILSKYSGADHLLAGQVIDLQSADKNLDFEKLKFMHISKTSSLFIACIEFACVIANTKDITKKDLISFAEDLGLIFQIQDDILDVESSSKKLGKPALSDIEQKKATAVSILGMKKAKDILSNIKTQIYTTLEKLNLQNSSLKKLIDLLINRTF